MYVPGHARGPSRPSGDDDHDDDHHYHPAMTFPDQYIVIVFDIL